MSKKILLVDDELEMLDFIAMRLEANGYVIKKAKNGIEGLEEAKNDKPDLIISDVLMPEMDGYTFYKELQKDKDLADIPVVILTARGKMEDSFLALGAKDFMAKPFKPEDLLEKIQSKLQKPLTEEEPQEQPQVEEPPAPESTVEKIGRIFVAGSTEKITNKITKNLNESNFDVESVFKASGIVKKVIKYNPNILVLDVLIDGTTTKEIIVKLKKSRECKNLPIITFSYFDYDDAGGRTSPQFKIEKESSCTTCHDAGATDYIGEYSHETLTASINKQLSGK